jgi:hypothetical protein
VIGDATDAALEDAGAGRPVDSRRYGPVSVEALVARAWLRYWPIRRAGRLSPPPDDLLARALGGVIPVPAKDPGAGEADPGAGQD